MCFTRLDNFFCINEGRILPTNSDNSQENETVIIPSDINETCIAVNSVLLDIIVQELAQQSLERHTFN